MPTTRRKPRNKTCKVCRRLLGPMLYKRPRIQVREHQWTIYCIDDNDFCNVCIADDAYRCASCDIRYEGFTDQYEVSRRQHEAGARIQLKRSRYRAILCPTCLDTAMYDERLRIINGVVPGILASMEMCPDCTIEVARRIRAALPELPISSSYASVANDVIGACPDCHFFRFHPLSVDYDSNFPPWRAQCKQPMIPIKDWPADWWVEIASDRLQQYPDFVQTRYRRDKHHWRLTRCHVCWEPFGFNEDELGSLRAISWLRSQGLVVEKALSIGGRRCIKCLVNALSPYDGFYLWLWRDDDSEGEFGLRDYLVRLADGRVNKLDSGQNFTLTHSASEGHPYRIIVLNETGEAIGRITRMNERRLSRELDQGLAWHATVNMMHDRSARLRLECVLEDSGLLPQHWVRRNTARRRSQHATTSNLTFQDRWFVLQRDNFTCVYCGASAVRASQRLVVDHIIPRSRGGGDRPDNLATCCNACNAGKGSQLLGTTSLSELQEMLRSRAVRDSADDTGTSGL